MSGDLYIKNVNIVTMDSPGLIRNGNILVKDGYIAEIGNEAKEVEGVEILDGHDSYVIPGLFDMHVHLDSEDHFPLFLMNGITGIREMGNKDSIFDIRQKVKTSELLGPSMYICGPILEGNPPVWDDFKILETRAQATESVSELAGKGADFIKVYHTLGEDLLNTVIEQAHSHNLKVTGHISHELNVVEAIKNGQNGVEHMSDITDFVGEIKMRDAREDEEPGYKVFTDYRLDEEAVDSFLSVLSKDIYLCPTLVLDEKLSGLADYESLRNEPEAAYLDYHYKDVDWNPSHPNSSANIQGLPPLFFDNLRVIHEGVKPLVKDLAKHGTLLAGSDTPNPFVVPGFSLIRELELLLEAGLSNSQVLEAATVNGAKFLDMADNAGSIAPGKVANMVMLEGNPLEDIGSLRNIEATILNGRVYTKEYLQTLLGARS